MTMRWIARAAAVFLTSASLLAVVGPLAAAEPAVTIEHFVFDQGTFVESFDAGEGPCVAYAGAFTETRAMEATLRIFHDGANAGTFQVVFTVRGSLSIEPTDPEQGVAYTGSLVERGTATGVMSRDGEDVPRTAHWMLTAPMRGDDGSRLTLRLSGVFITDGEGSLRVVRERHSCTP